MEVFKIFGNLAINFKDAIDDLGKVDKAADSIGPSAKRSAREMDREFDKASSGAKKSTGGFFSHLGNGLSKIGSMGLGVGAIISIGAKAIDFIKGGLDGVREAEEAASALQTVITSTGNAAGVSKQHLLDFSNQMQESTRFSAEQVNEGQKLLLTFTKIGAKDGIFDQATAAAADMATTLKTDLTSASMLVGKALNDPVKGMSALTKSGVGFTVEQKKAVAAMVKLGDTAGAQRVILKELETQFGGSAKAAGQTFAGKLERAQNALGEMAEEIAVKVIPYIDKFLAVIIQNMPRIQKFVTVAAEAIAKALTIVGGLLDVLSKFLEGDFTGAWKAMQGVISKVFAAIVPIIQAGVALAGKAFTALGNEMVKAGASLIDGAIKGIQSGLINLKNAVFGAGANAIEWFKNAIGMASPAKKMTPAGRALLDGVIKGIKEREEALKKAIEEAAEASAKIAQEAFERQGALIGDGVLLTLNMVERTTGAFKSYQDGVDKLMKAGVTLTGGLLDALETQFPRAMSKADKAIEHSAEVLRKASLITTAAYNRMSEVIGDGVQMTMSAVEQTAGVFTSYKDGMNKLFAAGVQVTAPLIEAMQKRFPVAIAETKKEITALGVTTGALTKTFKEFGDVVDVPIEAVTNLMDNADALALTLKDLDEETLRKFYKRAGETGNIVAYNAALVEMKRRADEAAAATKNLLSVTKTFTEIETPFTPVDKFIAPATDQREAPRIEEVIKSGGAYIAVLESANDASQRLNGTVGELIRSFGDQRETQRLLGNDTDAITESQIKQLLSLRSTLEVGSAAWLSVSQEVERLNATLPIGTRAVIEFNDAAGKGNVVLDTTAETISKVVGSDKPGSGGFGLMGVIEYAGKAAEALKKIGSGDVLGALLDVAEFIGNMVIPGLGSVVKGVVSIVQSLISMLFPPSALSVLTESLSKALEAGVRGGFGAGIKAFLEGKDGLQALYDGLKSNIVGAIVESLMQGAIISSGIKALTDKLGAALAGRRTSEAQSLIAQIGATAKGVMASLAPTLTQLKGSLDSAFPTAANGDPITRAAPDSSGGDKFLASSSQQAALVFASNAPERIENAAGKFEGAVTDFSGATGAFTTAINRFVSEGVRVRLDGALGSLATDLRGM